MGEFVNVAANRKTGIVFGIVVGVSIDGNGATIRCTHGDVCSSKTHAVYSVERRLGRLPTRLALDPRSGEARA